MKEFDQLDIDNQLCFPLYVCAKEVVKKYKPFLDEIDLTYTQYITMMILWKEKSVGMKELGNKIFLDSGTLTPLLKKLESKGYVVRERGEDERTVYVTITKEGMALRKKAEGIPGKISSCICLTAEEAKTLYTLLHKVID